MASGLNDRQAQAADLAVRDKIVIITGGPGTGKTFTTTEIVSRWEGMGLRYALCSPTGKAAKRLAEQTRKPASTIHRLLCYQPETQDFAYNRETPLPFDAIIVDEFSMVDVELFGHFLDAVRDDCRLVFVGDKDQLPSVGPGNVLHDLIECGKIPVVRLEKIYRFDEKCWISLNAKRINDGLDIVIEKDSKDFFFAEIDSRDGAFNSIVKTVCERIPKKFGMNPVTDIQALAPMKRGPIGVERINEALQASLNPGPTDRPRVRSGKKWIYEGDKVIHTKNNYRLGVFNGETGIVKEIASSKSVAVDYGDRVVVYDDSESLRELQMAYCLTIHKSQGSEFPAIVVPVHSTHSFMLNRNLLYTAVTRAKQLVVLVGNRKGLDWAIQNNRSMKRNTLLSHRLRGQDVA